MLNEDWFLKGFILLFFESHPKIRGSGHEEIIQREYHHN